MKTRSGIESIIIRLVCLVAGMVVCGTLRAQTECRTNANEKYALGQFDEASRILRTCLPAIKNDNEKFQVHKLLAKTYIANDYYDSAGYYIREMLHSKPEYTPDPSEEPLTFVERFNEVKETFKRENLADEIVTTATKRAQRSSDAPTTIYVRTRDQILMRGYRNLIDLLEDIPEIEIQKNSISEFRNVVSIRGIAGNEKFIIMLDGVRITPPTGDPYALGTNYSLVNAKRVEVLLGPSSALYGVDAFSGIINIITVDAADVRQYNLRTSFGAYNTGDHSVLLAAKPGSDVNLTLAGQYYHSAEPDFYNLYKSEFAWYREQYLPEGLMDVNGEPKQVSAVSDRKFEMPTFSYFISGKLVFKDFEIGGSRNMERHSSSVSVDPRYTLYTRDAFIAQTFQSAYARHTVTADDGRWSLKSYLTSGQGALDPDSKFMNRYTEYEKGYKYQFSRSSKIEEQFERDLFRSTTMICGVSFEDLNALPKTADLPFRYDVKTPAAGQDIYYLNTDTVDANGRSLRIAQDFHYLNYQNYGAYVQFNSALVKFTELTLGGRFDYNTRFGGVFNPRLGVVVTPTPRIKAKLLYGTAFLAPSPWKAYSTFGSFEPAVANGSVTGLQSPFFHIPNTTLRPERLTSLEGGAVVFLTTRLTVSVDAYYNRISDLINIQAPAGTGTFKGVDVAYVEKAINQGLAHMYGGAFNISSVHQIAPHNLSLQLSYAHTNGDIAGKPLTLTARHAVKASADWSVHRFSLSTRLIFRTQSNSVIMDAEGNHIPNSAFAVVNVFARYKLIENEALDLSATLRISNLTNARYYNAAAGQDSFYATPQDPFRIEGGISLGFR